MSQHIVVNDKKNSKYYTSWLVNFIKVEVNFSYICSCILYSLWCKARKVNIKPKCPQKLHIIVQYPHSL